MPFNRLRRCGFITLLGQQKGLISAGLWLLIVAGLATASLAIFSPSLSLGTKEEFLFYHWAGIARRELTTLGFSIAAIAVAFLLLGSNVFVLPFRAIAFFAMQWRAVTLVFGSVAISVFFLEVALRLLEGVPLTSTENFVARALNEVRQTGSYSVYDPQLGWAPLPNQGEAGEYGVRMPRQGQIPLRKQAVLMVGDSFGAGAEVVANESWPAQLEAALGFQVINAGVGGYGFDQIVLRAEMLASLLEPKVLLVESRLEYGISVARMSVASGAPKPLFRLRNGALVLQHEVVPLLASRSDDIGSLRAVLGHSYLVQFAMTRLNMLQWWTAAAYYRNKFDLSETEAVEVTCQLMNRLAQLRDRQKLRIILVVQYSGVDAITSTLEWDRATVLNCTREAGLEVVDTLEPLRTVYQSQGIERYQKLWVMHDNNKSYGHMSALGNGLIATLVAAQIANGDTRSR